MKTFVKTTLSLSVLLGLVSCDPSFNSYDVSELADGSSQTGSTQPVVGEPESDNPIGETDNPPSTSEALYVQDFESFDNNRNWFLSDFGLDSNSSKEEYTDGKMLKFDIRWTNRSRKMLADKMGYERKEMTHELANSLCEPKIEIGKEKAYVGGSSQNMISELDTDMSHCSINGNEPAAISIRSFVKTQIGHKYKVSLSYKMRNYSNISDKSYRDLVVRFGRELEKFDSNLDGFKTVELNTIAVNKFSKLVLKDNGLPNSFGVLVDDIKVYDLGKVDNYDTCLSKFKLNSRGFKKCVVNEVDTDQTCDFSDLSTVSIKASDKAIVSSNRRVKENIFNTKTSGINFFSLGLKGRVNLACTIDGHRALYDVFGKTVSFREISFGNVNMSSYPEMAKVRVKLQDCENEELNKTITIGEIKTKEIFEYTFEENTEGVSYFGCKMNKLIIKDITPNGPSHDGVDINSFSFSE